MGAAVALLGVCLLAVASAPTASRRALAPAGVITAALAVALAVPTPTDGPALQVATVQGNVPRSGVGAFAEDLLVLDNHLRETERLAAQVLAGTRPRPDLVIWPENASDQDPRTEAQSRARVEAAVEALGQPLLLGAVLRDGPTGLSNGLVVYGEGGVQGEPYRKQHLVPFGEYLPLRALVERLYPPAAMLLARDFSPGERVGRLNLNGVPLAVGTCFEVAFDDLPREAVRAGGELLVLPSNNASYGRSAQSAQQLAMARLRAVEHGRSTVVSTTTGISALVRPDGEVVERSALFTPAVLQAELPTPHGPDAGHALRRLGGGRPGRARADAPGDPTPARQALTSRDDRCGPSPSHQHASGSAEGLTVAVTRTWRCGWPTLRATPWPAVSRRLHAGAARYAGAGRSTSVTRRPSPLDLRPSSSDATRRNAEG